MLFQSLDRASSVIFRRRAKGGDSLKVPQRRFTRSECFPAHVKPISLARAAYFLVKASRV
jgi:hypothetical protein